MSRAVKSSGPDRKKLALYGGITILIVAVIVAIGLLNQSSVKKAASDAPINSTLKVGDTAPEFKVQTNAGPVDLASVGTPVLLEVFATWCPHCQRETSVLNSLAQKYAGKVQIVAVSGSPTGMDGNTPESQADVNQFGQNFNVRYPIAYDGDLAVAQKYISGGYPTIVVIDKNKKVTWITSGETPQAAIEKQINAVI
ncbi:MAG TPA: TlpA disulfide reductase family protein [Candidatus Elarobacter sp.]